MAGSYKHLLDKRGNFTFEFIENMGDAYEACEDCFNLIRKLKRERKLLWVELTILKKAKNLL